MIKKIYVEFLAEIFFWDILGPKSGFKNACLYVGPYAVLIWEGTKASAKKY